MSILKKVQNSIGKVLAGSETPVRRTKQVHNYSDAQSLAVLFVLKDENQYQTIRQYTKFVKDEHGIKNVMALCYVEDKEVPNYIQSRVDFEFFTKKDVNWQQKPSGTVVDNFIEEDYHILIDLCEGEKAVANFIVNSSKAHFKIGHGDDSKAQLYDLMIQLPNDNHNLRAFIEQVNHYLTLINCS